MTFDINEFKLDAGAKASGVWVEFGDSAAFKIGAFDNPNFTSAFRKATKPYSDFGRTIGDEEQVEIMCRCMADHVLLDWRNVFDGGAEFEYSRDNAYRLLKELEWIRTKIITEAQKLENFKAAAREETEGN